MTDPSRRPSRRQLLRIAVAGASGVPLSTSAVHLGFARPSAVPISPESFGAVGDGVTDDYPAFQNMAAAVTAAGGGIILFGRNKIYRINRHRIVDGPKKNANTHIRFDRCSGLVIDLNGSKIDIKGEYHQSSDYSSGPIHFSWSRSICPLFLNECTDFEIKNGEIDGNVDNMTRDPQVKESDNHGVLIFQGRRGRLSNLHIHHTACDGIYIGENQLNGSSTVSEDITLQDVRSLYNARQAMSVTGCAGLAAIACEFSHTGSAAGAYGALSPAAGVDVEPLLVHNRLSSASFLRCRFIGNRGSVFVASTPEFVDSVSLIDCVGKSYDNTNGNLTLSVRDGAVVRGEYTDVTINPAVTLGPTAAPNIVRFSMTGATIIHTQAGRELFADNSPNAPITRYANNRIEFRSLTAKKTTYAGRIDNPNCTFENNTIFVADTFHPGGAENLFDMGAGRVSGNTWRGQTRLTWYVIYSSARQVGDDETLLNGMSSGGTIPRSTTPERR